MYFAKSQCKAELTKHLTYSVDVCISVDGEVKECSCECTAGRNNQAHCKHVTTTLLGLLDASQGHPIKTWQTTTQQLQTFHQPAKRFCGEPMVAQEMTNKRCKSLEIHYTDVDSQNLCGDENYQAYFDNLIKSSCFNKTMSQKQLMMPANPYGTVNDHGYDKHNHEENLLCSMGLYQVTKSYIIKLEEDTMLQHTNKIWHDERSVRLTSSNFEKICSLQAEKQKVNAAQSMLYPKQFWSESTAHGKNL